MRTAFMATRFGACVLLALAFAPANAQAGPLLDWLFGRNRAPAYPVGQPVPANTAYYGGYAPTTPYTANYGYYNGPASPVVGQGTAGYRAPVPTGIAAATVPSTLSYVPNYRTSAYRAPVTYYRPIVTTDPNTGAQVVTMAPCTSYEYQTQRVPTLGRRALYPSALLPSLAPTPRPTIQTYTLPNGGVALPYATQPIAPGVSGYRGYAYYQQPTYQQPTNGLVAPTGSYPSSPYYGNSNGGCTGSYSAPNTYANPVPSNTVPGTIAPQGPNVIRTPVPGYGREVAPPAGAGGAILPSDSGVPSTDPRAFEQPSLKPELEDAAKFNPDYSSDRFSSDRYESRPGRSGTTLRSVTQQPSTRAKPLTEADASRPPLMAPIPVPSGFDKEPSWSPGLLSDQDKTAQRQRDLQNFSGQSTRIHWAKFEKATDQAAPVSAPPSGNSLRYSTSKPVVDQSIAPLRTNSRSYGTNSRGERGHGTRSSTTRSQRYDDSGWSSSRK